MIVEMLAGDELAPERPRHAAGDRLPRPQLVQVQSQHVDATTTVEHTAKAFLGLTLNCARCHDHKYDPIAQNDYYGFRAFFEPHQVRTERLPGQPDVDARTACRGPTTPTSPRATYLYLRGDEKQPDKEHPVTPGVPSMLEAPFAVEPVELPDLASFPSLAEHIEREELAAAEGRLAAARSAWEQLMAMHRVATLSGGREPPDSGSTSETTFPAPSTHWFVARVHRHQSPPCRSMPRSSPRVASLPPRNWNSRPSAPAGPVTE